jgi:type IV secretory pathway TrbF-like protein
MNARIESAGSPYAAARREWNERNRHSIAQVRKWRSTAIASLIVTLLLTLYAIRLVGQSSTIPYVVEIDKHGTTVAVSRADFSATPDSSVVRAQLAAWIRDARGVDSDPGIESAALALVYAKIGPGAKPYLGAWYSAHSPFAQGASGTVSVTIDNVLAISPTTYQLDWTEEQRDRDGANPIFTHWETQLTVGIVSPADAATIVRNPLGIYITQLSWTQRL